MCRCAMSLGIARHLAVLMPALLQQAKESMVVVSLLHDDGFMQSWQ